MNLLRTILHVNWRHPIALAFAVVYFSFQVELDAEEYERNHPSPSDGNAFRYSSENWESFDKENVRKAYCFDGTIQILFLFRLSKPNCIHSEAHYPYRLIQDKSPPQCLSFTAW